MSEVSTWKTIKIKWMNVPDWFSIFILLRRRYHSLLSSFVLECFGMILRSCNIILWFSTLIIILLNLTMWRFGACTFINWSLTYFFCLQRQLSQFLVFLINNLQVLFFPFLELVDFRESCVKLFLILRKVFLKPYFQDLPSFFCFFNL